jgi:hypothetical protein
MKPVSHSRLPEGTMCGCVVPFVSKNEYNEMHLQSFTVSEKLRVIKEAQQIGNRAAGCLFYDILKPEQCKLIQ